MKAKKGFLVTMDDGSTQFVDYYEVNPSDEKVDETGLLNRFFSQNESKTEESTTPYFIKFLKYFAYLLLAVGDITFLLFALSFENIFHGIATFVGVNIVIVMLCWLFYTVIFTDSLDDL